MAGESRAELLAWLNELLAISYTKIEQCGTGAAYCQIIDSIYGDVPMARVKMNAKHEYEFVANYKILQTVFKNKKIDRPIPVEKLTKCKMQDNLEFLQWIKRYWNQNYPGQPYDAVARRKGAPVETPVTIVPLSSTNRLASGPPPARGKTPVGGPRAGSAQQNETIVNLQAQLRDIEILVQTQLEVLEAAGNDDETLKEIQKILYSTEEGFEVPENGGPVDEEETF
ncbi:hypothetical protein Clacol_009582 [Clathrus columnatus]|uniref:Calponin-homology (CH) domain-containing protein n=1 Tax=Clathrus columnatus TaxID=1419009 RepID=A0AAV5ASI1_9AGAM|nr:hypothetical protein Clacol_009582 [Clathrus columnatus]